MSLRLYTPMDVQRSNSFRSSDFGFCADTLTWRTFEVINIHLKESEAVDVAEGFLDDGWLEFKMTLEPPADTPYQPTPLQVSGKELLLVHGSPLKPMFRT